MYKDKCKCSMSISVLGDGCRYCQPQEHIDTYIRLVTEDTKEIEHLETALQGLKDEINRVWYLAYPLSAPTGNDVAKLRVTNIYQDLEDTRFNYRVLHKAYNELDKEQRE